VTGLQPRRARKPWGCFARGVVRAYHAKNVVSGRQMHKPGTDKCMNPGPTQTMPPDYAAPSSAPTDAAVPEMAQPTPMTSTATFSATLVRDASPCTPRSRSAARGGGSPRAPRRRGLRASAHAALVRAHTAALLLGRPQRARRRLANPGTALQTNPYCRARAWKMRRWQSAGKMMDTDTVSSEPMSDMKYARKGT